MTDGGGGAILMVCEVAIPERHFIARVEMNKGRIFFFLKEEKQTHATMSPAC